MCLRVLYICGCAPVWVHCDSEAYHPALPPLKLGRTAAKTRICTFSSLREGPCKPLHNANRKPVPAQLSLWPLLCVSLSPLCSRNTSDTSTTQAEGRRRRRKNNWLALSCDMWQSFKKALVLQSRLDGCECNKSKAIIHRCFFFFWDIVGVYLYSNTERKRQTDFLEIAWLKRALLKDRILIFNALQLYQLNRISSEGITCMVKNVRCYKCLAEIDRISQEMCVERPEDGESLTLSLRVY